MEMIQRRRDHFNELIGHSNFQATTSVSMFKSQWKQSIKQWPVASEGFPLRISGNCINYTKPLKLTCCIHTAFHFKLPPKISLTSPGWLSSLFYCFILGLASHRRVVSLLTLSLSCSPITHNWQKNQHNKPVAYSVTVKHILELSDLNKSLWKARQFCDILSGGKLIILT